MSRPDAPPVPTDQITVNRFEEWRQVLHDAHSTPALLIGVGHDDHSGEMHVLIPDGTPNAWLRAWLKFALSQLPDD